MAASGRRNDGWAATSGTAMRVARPRLLRMPPAANDNRPRFFTFLLHAGPPAAVGVLCAVAVCLLLGF